MQRKLINIIIYTGFSIIMMHCGGDDKPVEERVLKHEQNLKAISDSIRTATEKIDSLLLNK